MLLLGQSEKGFVPLEDGDVVKLVAGGQGGHHVWVSLRMKNLQAKPILTLTGHVPELGLTVGPLSEVTKFAEEVGTGYCERWGYPFQLDSSVDVAQLLGKTLKITAEVADKDGDSAAVTKTVEIAPTL